MAMLDDSNVFGNILVIDDDQEVCGTMKSLLTRMLLHCETVSTLRGGLEKLRSQNFDVVFLDVRLPDGNGLDALGEIKALEDSPEVIILTGQGDPDGAELAIQGGVWDYLVKPTPIKQTMLSVQRALKYREEKRAESPVVAMNLDNMIGYSSGMHRIFDLMAQSARSLSATLITGETGTGKELTARTIHENSGRRTGRFVVLDCASLTETLVESTLFGHRRGAFTGADKDRTGLIKMADGGTLFLDEIGELPLNVQKSFLRVLQEKRFRPVGSLQEETSDFRLIAATNRNLENRVHEGKFREDLLFRLKTIAIELPPLRERIEDIKPLSLHHITRLCEQYKVPVKGFGSDFFEVLGSYRWPGNVRELFNVLERAFVASGQEKTLYAMHLPQDIRIKVAKATLGEAREDGAAEGPQSPLEQEARSAAAGLESLMTGDLPDLRMFKSLMEKQYLQTLIERCGGDLNQILRISGLSRSHYYALLKKSGLSAK
ncbi:sigma-54 dependent transcriptional regulator [Desulfobaculum bizertense]|uniref:sigma-54-dependent transcriptional regulator n=1 Tax=Desulfobaculum bizertense TaxID=376490 RepID=UPI001F2F3069|nr:sigma-54 dependent transcriptional regulator [Desulfobaculum bizertense]UIJ37854.1 sigma-54 dependent transcriptional regulator [Desulfobaculum bizertense]